jgi:hypothetical protein
MGSDEKGGEKSDRDDNLLFRERERKQENSRLSPKRNKKMKRQAW